MLCHLCGLQEPHALPELMAYMAFTIRVSQDYEGLGWVWYDLAFRQQAALSGNRKWSVINSTLFSMNAPHQCDVVSCVLRRHIPSGSVCIMVTEGDPDVGDRLWSLETAVLAMARLRPPSQEPGHHQGRPVESGMHQAAHFPRHLHVCSMCDGGHPASRCGTRGIGGSPAASCQWTRPYKLKSWHMYQYILACIWIMMIIHASEKGEGGRVGLRESSCK